MQTGMLWFDNDPKTALTAKIARAVEYYRKKYGEPNLCLIHPSMLPASQGEQEENHPETGIFVRPYRYILPGHLWIGVEQAAGAVEKRSAELVQKATLSKVNVERAIQAVMEL